jgi:hypothetical protein
VSSSSHPTENSFAFMIALSVVACGVGSKACGALKKMAASDGTASRSVAPPARSFWEAHPDLPVTVVKLLIVAVVAYALWKAFQWGKAWVIDLNAASSLNTQSLLIVQDALKKQTETLGQIQSSLVAINTRLGAAEADLKKLKAASSSETKRNEIQAKQALDQAMGQLFGKKSEGSAS